MRRKHFWLLITLVAFIFSSRLEVHADSTLEFFYESVNRDLPYYQMTVCPVYSHHISRQGMAVFDYSRSRAQTLKYSHFTTFRGRSVEIGLGLGKTEAEGSWDLTQPDGYWYGEGEEFDSNKVRIALTYFLSQDLGLKVGLDRENFNRQGFNADNGGPWRRGDWNREEERDGLILGIEKGLFENVKLECTHTSIEQNQDFEFYAKSLIGTWSEDICRGKFKGDGWRFEATYLPKSFLRLTLLSSFEKVKGDTRAFTTNSDGEKFKNVFYSSATSLKRSEHDLTFNFLLTKRLSFNLGYSVEHKNHIYNYIDNSTLDYTSDKGGPYCGFQLLIVPNLKLRLVHSHADFHRKDRWYYLSERTPGWKGKGEENKINLGLVFNF